ncbi:MAG: exo-alpha-sialidase, partial [Candidatus Limnocylindrus sp.]
LFRSTAALLTALLLAPLAALCAAERIPAAPKNVRVTETSPAHIRVEWNDAVQNETGFRIWRRRLTDEGTRPWHLAGEVPAKVTHFDDGGLNHETEYEHKVAAFGPAGQGEAVAVAKATRTPRMVAHLEPQVVVPAGKSAAVAPSALAEPDGRILLAYSHSGTVWLRRSSDGGKTWGDEQLTLPKPPQGYYTKAALARLRDGSVGLAFTHLTPIDGSKPLDRKRLFTRSRDGSPPWSEPVLMGRSSANNAALILADHGRLLDPLDDGRHPSALIVASDDDGATWRTLSEVAAKPEARPTGESSLVHLGAGKLVFLSRHEQPFYNLNFSADNGASWEQPGTLWLGGGDNPPKIATIPGTNLLVAVVSSWFDGVKSKDRRQLASVISADGGRTWDNFRLIGFAPEGDDGFVQYSLSFGGDTAYLFYGGGTKGDTAHVTELRLLRLHRDFFTSRTPWPYDWKGQPKP